MRSLAPICEDYPLLPIAGCLMTGIALGGEFNKEVSSLLLVLFAGSVLLTFLLRGQRLMSIAVLLSVTLLGAILAIRQQTADERLSFTSSYKELKAVVASEPMVKPHSIAYDLLLADDGRKLKCYFQQSERSELLKPGDGLVLNTRVQGLSKTDASNQSDAAFQNYSTYLRRHGFAGQCYAANDQWHGERISLGGISKLERIRIRFLCWRHQLLEKYKQLGAHHDVYGVLAAMTLGDKSALEKNVQNVYSVTGASHVLALSGLHLGILYLLLVWLMDGKHWQRRLFTQIVLVATIWAFTFLAGLPVSLIRAAVMLTIFTVVAVGRRSHTSVNVLFFTAILLLLHNPNTLYDVGFQLSFMAVFSILVLTPLFKPLFNLPRLQRQPLRVICQCMAVSLMAQVGVAPLIAYYFGRFSTYFLLTNLVVLPAAYMILIGSLLMLVIPLNVIAAPVFWLVDTLNSLLEYMSKLPLSSIENLHPSGAQVILYYVIVACLGGVALVVQGRWYKSLNDLSVEEYSALVFKQE